MKPEELEVYQGDGAINKLIDDLGEDAANYCCDAAGLHDEASSAYEECMVESSSAQNIANIAIACMSFQNGVQYSRADEGPVQKSLYKALVSRSSEDNQRYCEFIQSKDVLTNFGYVLKILLRVLNNIEEEDIRGLAWMSYGRANPPYSSFYANGYAGESGISKKTELTDELKEALNEFAKNGSTLGNYSVIPTELPDLGLSGLNNMKGGVGASLFVYDEDRRSYRVNDQFALFAEWIEVYEEISKEEDRNVIHAWKEMMLFNNADEDGKTVWSWYLEAARCYKAIFQVERSKRLEAFAQYLKLVNAAIKLRSEKIVEKLNSKNS